MLMMDISESNHWGVHTPDSVDHDLLVLFASHYHVSCSLRSSSGEVATCISPIAAAQVVDEHIEQKLEVAVMHVVHYLRRCYHGSNLVTVPWRGVRASVHVRSMATPVMLPLKSGAEWLRFTMTDDALAESEVLSATLNSEKKPPTTQRDLLRSELLMLLACSSTYTHLIRSPRVRSNTSRCA